MVNSICSGGRRAGGVLAREILIEQLRRVPPCHLPGTDGLTTDVMLREYARLAMRGLVPGRWELLREFPQVADLDDYLPEQDVQRGVDARKAARIGEPVSRSGHRFPSELS